MLGLEHYDRYAPLRAGLIAVIGAKAVGSPPEPLSLGALRHSGMHWPAMTPKLHLGHGIGFQVEQPGRGPIVTTPRPDHSQAVALLDIG
jgi:hypothetical protein